MQARLFAWYEQQGRDFPWRHATDPWAILVSEVMSQQTRIDRVADRYESFLARFPTPSAMAASSRTAVLSEWSGLGYNRRALHLHATAGTVSRTGWPTTARALQALPGVGPYTAAAVACFAFGEQIPAVDTNLRRVLSRWAGRALSRKELIDEATSRIPDGQAATWNSAVMDLGALVCKPVPRCNECPVVRNCSDSTIYVRPPKQPPFEGSVRQARGAIIKLLLDGITRTAETLNTELGQDVAHVLTALGGLTKDGILVHGPAGFAIARRAPDDLAASRPESS